MTLVDTHCHLADPAYDPDRPDVVSRARAAGVHHIIVIGDSLQTSQRAQDVATEAALSSTAGVHPHEASSWKPETADRIEDLLAETSVVAVGEIGLDYYYEHSPRGEQRAAFEAQLELADRFGKPVVIHARDADDDMIAALRDAPEGITLIMHSFSSGDRVLEAALARDAYISFSGMITFRRWEGDEWVRAVADDRLLVETDGPYLAPVPHRGQRNEPQYLTATADRAATVRSVSVDDLARQTTANAVRCFSLAPGLEDD